MFGNAVTRASPSNLLQCLMSFCPYSVSLMTDLIIPQWQGGLLHQLSTVGSKSGLCLSSSQAAFMCLMTVMMLPLYFFLLQAN